ncbi:MAG: V-type ATP synthase subunit D [Cyclobacteriaceae bacterium]|nr:V-type ATP synthase subunit D [Cyclobacteriaceae bacterium]
MALNFKYNKSALYELGEQLKVREKALPTLKSKESALRSEIKRTRQIALDYEAKLQKRLEEVKNLARLWVEFEDGLVSIKTATYKDKTIAGVKIPVLENFEFELREISQYHKPDWFLDGIHILKEFTELSLRQKVTQEATRILEQARKKTTQKVNLYEKVQIPAFEEAIRKIKRFLEDEENLSKAAQKILKRRNEEIVAS